MMLFVKPHLFAFCVCFLCQCECVYTVGSPMKACDQAQISVGDGPEDVVLMCPFVKDGRSVWGQRALFQ